MTQPSRTAYPDEALNDAARGTAPTAEPSDADETVGEIDAIGVAAGIPTGERKPLAFENQSAKRDAHRWELDPASAEDAKGRLP